MTLTENAPTGHRINEHRKALLVWLIIAEIWMLGSLVLWLVVAGLSVMAFDSGPSVQAYMIVGGVWLYPLIPIACSAAAWIFYAKKKTIPALICTTPPLLLPIVFIAIVSMG